MLPQAVRRTRPASSTHVLFESDPFIERMRIDDPRLVVPDFTDLLEALPWKKLA